MAINTGRRPSARPKTSGRQPALTQSSRPARNMEGLLDDLAIFEELRTTLIPALRDAVQRGASTEEMLMIGKSAALARLVSMAVLEAGGNLGAIKELLDRTEGKVTDTKTITHRLDKMKGEEIDAYLLSAVSESSLTDEGDE